MSAEANRALVRHVYTDIVGAVDLPAMRGRINALVSPD